MRPVLFVLALMLALLPAAPASAADTIRIDLNAIEPVQNRCLISFVVENKTPAAIDVLKLDLAVFDPEGIIRRRLIVELGPLRRAKTMVKAFELDADCTQLGAILVNDVTQCAPADAGTCLDETALTSRPRGVRFFK